MPSALPPPRLTGGRNRAAYRVEQFHEVALLGMLLSGLLAMMPGLGWPWVAGTAGVLALRIATLAGWGQFEISSRLVPWLGLLGTFAYMADAFWISGTFVEATLHLVCFLACVKMLSARTARDFVWVRVIALLELLAASMVATGPGFFLCFILFMVCAVAGLASGEIVKAIRSLPEKGVARTLLGKVPMRLAGVSMVLCAAVLAMTVVLFFILPRTARAALQRFVPPGYHVPGFAREIRLGEIGELKRNDTPVAHARPFREEQLPAMRWKGSTLTLFDGRRWYNPTGEEQTIRVEGGFVSLEERLKPGRELQYQVVLAPGAADTLLFAGSAKTVTVSLRTLVRDSGGAVRVPRVAVSGLRYGVFAVVEDPGPEVLLEATRRRMVRLPRLDPRVSDLSREVTAGLSGKGAAMAVETYLKEKYSYTLELPEHEEADPVAEFLFTRRKGHCEYFASAMTVMLRSVGIPARIATGFLNGTYNSMTGWQVLRASDAHSWVEAWIEGEGWVTFDPTPPDPNAVPPMLDGFPMLSDAAGQLWQDWVVGYDFQRQAALAGALEQSGGFRPWQWLSNLSWRWPSVTILGMVFAVVLWALRKRLRRARGPEEAQGRQLKGAASEASAAYVKILEALEQKGVRKPAWVTPAEFVGMLNHAETAELMGEATGMYHLSRFGGREAAAGGMNDILRRIEQLQLQPRESA